MRQNWHILGVWGVDKDTLECLCPKGTACDVAGKHPREPNGLKSAEPLSVDSFNALCQVETLNFGLSLEPSGLVALDVDGYHGDAEKLAALEAELGELPDTLIQESGSGGSYHLIFKAPPNINIRGAIGGIVLRHKAYIVIAPSRHKSGGSYKWLNPDAEIAELPPKWVAAIERPKATPNSIGPESEPRWLQGIGDSAREARLIELLRKEAPEIKGVSEPGSTFNALRRAIRGSACKTNLLDLVETYYNQQCDPPWEHDKLVYKLNQMGACDSPDWGESWQTGATRWEDLGLPAKAERKDTAPIAPATPSELSEHEQALKELRDFLNTSTDSKPVFNFVNGVDLVEREYPKNRWLVEGLITQDSVCVISTEPKSAKTWAATEIAVAIATGTPAFGEFKTPTAKAVCYFYAEDVGASIKSKLIALAHARGLSAKEAAEQFNAIPKGATLNLMNDDEVAAFIVAARRIPNLGLIGLDPMRDIHDGKEDSSDEISKVMKRLRALTVLCKCSVLVVHHSVKSSADNKARRGGQKMRGSSAIHGAIDCGLYFSDLKTNGKNKFTNRVEVEIKSARGAGVFELTLDLKDDAHGSAIQAKWSVGEVGEAKKEETVSAITDTEVASVLSLLNVDTRGSMTSRQLRQHMGCRNTKAKMILEHVASLGLIKARNENNPDTGWVILPEGRLKLQELPPAHAYEPKKVQRQVAPPPPPRFEVE